jgi:PAS domain S-box-containing protein
MSRRNSNLDNLRKLTESLNEKELLTRNFFELSKDLMVIVKDRHFIDVNPVWTSVLGWEKPELVGQPWIKFIHPDDIEASLIMANGVANGFVNRYVTKTGEHVAISWSRLSVDAKGYIYAIGRVVKIP